MTPPQLARFAGFCLLMQLAACSVVTLSDKPAPVVDPQRPPVLLPQPVPTQTATEPTPPPPLIEQPPAVVPPPPPEVEPEPQPEPPPLPAEPQAPPAQAEPTAPPVLPPESEAPDSELMAPPTAQELALPETHSNSPASLATNPKAYRQDAAKHLYRVYANRIYKGKLPPMLKAIGVVDVLIGPQGQVLDIHWVRPPRQGPGLIADIENMIRRAAPYPAPVNLRKLIYTETWLWHASGRFQLDTLSEGQK